MTLELKKFNMRDITFKPDENKGPVVVLIGRRDTGKSYLVRDLLYYHQDILLVLLFLVLKLVMVFIKNTYLNFLFTMNTILFSLRIF